MRTQSDPMAEWDRVRTTNLLLRRLDVHLAGANWQRGGGKGQRPKPIELPDAKGRGATPARTKPAGADIAQRLQNLGLIPPGQPETAEQ